jgi:hypothetical protein
VTVDAGTIRAVCLERDDFSQADDALYPVLPTLIGRLERAVELGTSVIEWGCPVPCFGNISRARVATVGLNPSNREFVDETGHELAGEFRRFHTLASLRARISSYDLQRERYVFDPRTFEFIPREPRGRKS